MTTEIELLPLPEGSVAHLIAAQDAEIEALRAEVGRDTALLRQALEALEQIARDLPWELTGLQADTITTLRDRLGEGGRQ